VIQWFQLVPHRAEPLVRGVKMSEATITATQTADTAAADLTAGDRFEFEGNIVTVAGTRTGDGSSADEDTGWTFVALEDESVLRFASDDTVKVLADGTATAVDLTQCTAQSPSGRRCKLHPDHVNSADAKERKHRFVIREEVAQPKTLAELRKENKKLASFTLSAEAIPAGEDVSRQYNREIERDDDQKRVDADAKKAYDKWVKGGSKKGAFEDIAPKFGSRYIVPPEAFDTVIMMLRRSTQSGAATYGKKMAYRRGTHTSGNTIINWMIVDQGTFPKSSKDNGGNGES
jgi:hypothetical protein